MCAGWLAICGVPIFAGFFSKDEILWKTWSGQIAGVPPGFGKALWFIGAVTALLTAIYMTRMMVMTFWGRERFSEAHTEQAHGHDEHHGAHQPHESPLSMTIPLIVLAVLSLVGGLVGVPYALSGGRLDNYFEHTLEPVVSEAPAPGETSEGSDHVRWLSTPPQPIDGRPALEETGASHGEAIHNAHEISQERLFTGISILIAFAGIGIGWLMFLRQPLRKMPRLLENKYYVDEIYDATIIQPILVTSREGLWKIFDVGVIDGIVNGVGRMVTRLGGAVRQMQGGFVRGYAAIILAGALIIIAYFAYNSTHVLRILVR
jgi:NADH-quinone oxidoreductase subunit L